MMNESVSFNENFKEQNRKNNTLSWQVEKKKKGKGNEKFIDRMI